jgi:SSS family solute:Na+ symporter
LAFLCRRANKQGVYVGIVASILFTAWATLTSKGKLDLGNFAYTLHPYLIGVFANIVLFVVGYAASLTFPHRESSTSLTVWGWLGDRRPDSSEKTSAVGPAKAVAAE